MFFMDRFEVKPSKEPPEDIINLKNDTNQIMNGFYSALSKGSHWLKLPKKSLFLDNQQVIL